MKKILFSVVFLVAVVLLIGHLARRGMEQGHAPMETKQHTSASPPNRSSGELDAAVSPTRPVLGIGLGGSGLNVQRNLQDALAKKGSSDAAVAASIQTANSACSLPVVADANAKAWNDADRSWALAYLKTACAGFDGDGFRYTGDDHTVEWHFLREGEAAAAAKANADLARADSFTHVVEAGQWLAEHKQLPDQASYGLTQDELWEAINVAARLRTCGANHACGSDSLVTAMLCAQWGCKPGTTLREALQHNTAPKTFDAAVRLQAAFAQQ